MEKEACERQFENTMAHLDNVRSQIGLPFRDNKEEFDEFRTIARKRLLSSEKTVRIPEELPQVNTQTFFANHTNYRTNKRLPFRVSQTITPVNTDYRTNYHRLPNTQQQINIQTTTNDHTNHHISTQTITR